MAQTDNFLIIGSTYRLIADVEPNIDDGWLSSTPSTNLLDYRPSLRSVSSSTTPYVEFDLQSDVSIQAFAIASHNGTSSDTWRVRADSVLGNLTSSPEYDSSSTAFFPSGSYQSTADSYDYKTSFITADNPMTVRYVRFDFSVSVGFECGVALMDKLIQPSRNMQLVHNPPSYKQRSEFREAHSGTIYIVRNAKRRETKFRVILTDRDEFYDDLWELERTHGTADPFVYVYQPTNADSQRGAMYCTLRRSSDISIPNYNLYESRMTLREVT